MLTITVTSCEAVFEGYTRELAQQKHNKDCPCNGKVSLIPA